MKKLLLLSGILLGPFFCNAQAVQDWTSGLPTLLNYNNHTIASDSQGNVYSIGIYNNPTDFDPGSGVFNMSAFSQSMYILKLDALGNFVWAKEIGGPTTYAITSATSITIDTLDNIYISGSTNTFFGPVDFDPGTGVSDVANPTGHYVMYILKLDANGNYIWDKQFSNPANTSNDLDTIQAMKVDAAGNIYATGGFNGTVDFDPGAGVFNIASVTSSLSTEIFILKLDSSGNFVWAKAMPNNSVNTGSKLDKGFAIDVDTSENVYTTGYYWFGIDADPGTATHSLISYTSNNPIITGSNTQYISKLDSSGNFVWAYDLVGDHSTGALPSLVVDSVNNVIISGYQQSNIAIDYDFSSGTYTLPIDTNSFIIKIDANASFIWAKSTARSTTGFSHTNYAPGLTLDVAGNIYTTGAFGNSSPADFDPSTATYNLTSAGYNDVYISKLDTNGNFVWASKIGGTGVDACYSIAVSPLGKVTVSGSTNAGFSRLSAVTTGGFLASFTQPSLAISPFDLDKNISIYPNPTSGNFNITVNENLVDAKVNIYNLLGQKIKNFNIDVLTTNHNLDKGMYLLEIEKDNIKTSKKLIVN